MDYFLLVDADSLMYSSCTCKKDESELGDGYIHDIDSASHKFDELMQGIVNHLEEGFGFTINNYLLFLEGPGNFRYFFYPDYKKNRRDREKPPLLGAMYEWVKQNHPCFISYNVESDDTIAATVEKYSDIDFVVASQDKDALTYKGVVYNYHFMHRDVTVIEEKDALYNFYTQMLTGDSADFVKGIKGIGEKKAKKILQGCSDIEWSYINRVYRAYLKEYGKRNAKMEYWKAYTLLRMHRANIHTPDIHSIIF